AKTRSTLASGTAARRSRQSPACSAQPGPAAHAGMSGKGPRGTAGRVARAAFGMPAARYRSDRSEPVLIECYRDDARRERALTHGRRALARGRAARGRTSRGRGFVVSALSLLLAGPAFATPAPSLQQKLESIAQGVHGALGVAVLDLDHGTQVAVRGNEP